MLHAEAIPFVSPGCDISAMSLLPLVGHEDVRGRTLDAIAEGRLPQTVLIAGPAGVGKQRFALWVAQRLACGAPTPEPCGSCSGCRQVLGLAHPDVHWFVPVPRPKAGEPDKQVEETAELLGEVMAERRERPLWTAPEGMAIHSVATARLLLRRAALTSVHGGPRVFIIGEAERLVPQESTPDAANALLKLLEEPPPGAHFLLTAADPQRVLPTIRSRSVMLRLNALPDAQVRAFLREHLALSGPALEARVEVAQGSIGLALAESGQRQKAREAATALLEAVRAGGAAPWERTLKQGPWQARGEFTEMLDALAELLGEGTREATGAPARDLPPVLRKASASPPRLVRAVEQVQAARAAAQGNVNPQLLLAVLADDLTEVLCR